jgi:flavorubredoxin
MTTTTVPTTVPTLDTRPHPVTPDSWLIPMFGAAPGGTWVGAHSLVIRGAEPVVVDTSCAQVRDQWFDQVSSVVDLDDVRWVFLSHDDHDHVGNLVELLDRCPRATLVANFLIVGRLGGTIDLPLDRMRWLDPGDSFEAGDRTLHLVRPPMFDSPATRGLVDSSTGLMWAVDSFGSLAHDAVYERDDLPPDLYRESFDALNAWNSPWVEWLDPARYAAHLEESWGWHPAVVASAHGPVLRGAQVDDAFRRTLDLAARPPLPVPGQPDLDAMVAAALQAPAVAPVPELVGG